jgi:hypothetical protein
MYFSNILEGEQRVKRSDAFHLLSTQQRLKKNYSTEINETPPSAGTGGLKI